VIRENVPLAPFTTLGIGGPARFFAEAASEEEVRRHLLLPTPERFPFSCSVTAATC
jgi:UDP-N-acetylmuramate dehydrogenase